MTGELWAVAGLLAIANGAVLVYAVLYVAGFTGREATFRERRNLGILGFVMLLLGAGSLAFILAALISGLVAA